MKGIRATGLKFFVFALASILLLMLLVNTMHNGVSGNTRGYTALFTDVSGLRVGDDVKVAGVRVGRVQSISVEKDGQLARVGFDLNAEQPILANTDLVMRYQNLVGQRYLAMVQPANHQAALPPGSTIPTKRTDPGFDLTQLLNGFRPLFEVLQPADVNKLATSLVEVLQGEGGTVESLLQQTATLTTFVANRDQVIDSVLTNLTPVLNNLSGHGTQLTATITSLKKLMQGLAADRQEIGDAVDGIGQLVGSTSDLLTQAQQPLISSVHQLRTVAGTLDQTSAQVIAAVNAFRTVFGGLGRATSYENAINIYACSLSLALGGININTAVAGGHFSKVCQ
jgi:phospholipid/cholesterol/gamma-HCH transport system substrate-binding protein